MFPGTKATSVESKGRESGVETVLVTFRFEEQRQKGQNILPCTLSDPVPPFASICQVTMLVPKSVLLSRRHHS